MILPDVNLLLYAYDTDSPHHPSARSWWEGCLSGSRPIGIPWLVVVAFVRLTTSRTAFAQPYLAGEALEIIRSWLARPHVRILDPGPRHLDLLAAIVVDFPALGALTTDAHLAAIAIEHQAELHSNDADFSRFSGLRWVNPLKAKTRGSKPQA
jgi:toxin-antitoxin system PIN domain toxin